MASSMKMCAVLLAICLAVTVAGGPAATSLGASHQSKQGGSALQTSSSCSALATAIAPTQAKKEGFLANKANQMGVYFKDGWQRCSGGCKGLWNNWGTVRDIRAREKKGSQITLKEHLILQRDSDLQKRMRDVKHQRIAGILTALMDMEKSCINDKDPRAAAEATAAKDKVKRVLEAPSWAAAVQMLGSGLVYNATALRPKEKRKADLSGVPPAAVKGANMAVGGSLNFLPAFALKFQVKGVLSNMAATDEVIMRCGGAAAIDSLERGDLLELCMERCVGDPSHTDTQLRAAAKSWVARTQALPSLVKEANPAKGILVCPYRSRLALLGVHAIESARQLSGAGDLPRELFLGGKSLKLGY